MEEPGDVLLAHITRAVRKADQIFGQALEIQKHDREEPKP